jgi:hypothetical protein
MNRALAVPAAVALLLVAGCTNDFAPQSDLLAMRVLAIQATPLELLPTEDVRVLARNYLQADVVEAHWTFCPLSAGAVSAYACAVHGPRCEIPLTPAPDGSVTTNPTANILDCLASLGVAAPVLPPSSQVLTVLRYRAVTTSGAVHEAILQVPQWTGAPPSGWERNIPPGILEVRIGGVQVWAGGHATGTPPNLPLNGTLPVELRIDPATVQNYVDAAGTVQTETMTGYFYTSGGTFSSGITTGVDTTTNLEGTGILPGQTTAEVWVVALDLRGGQTVAGPINVPIGP